MSLSTLNKWRSLGSLDSISIATRKSAIHLYDCIIERLSNAPLHHIPTDEAAWAKSNFGEKRYFAGLIGLSLSLRVVRLHVAGPGRS